MRQERICFAKNRRSQPLDVKIEVKETRRKIYNEAGRRHHLPRQRLNKNVVTAPPRKIGLHGKSIDI
jgi:hypothetical protein